MDGEHGPGVGRPERRHQVAAETRELVQGGGVEHAGGAQGRQFAVAVAGEGVGLDAEPFENLQRAEADRADGRLGDLGPPERIFLGGLVGRREGERRVDQVRESAGGVAVGEPGEDAVGVGQHVEDIGEQAGQIAHHADLLRPLAGEQDAEQAGRRAAAVGDAVRRVPAVGVRLALQFCRGGREEFRGVGVVRHHREQPARRGRVEQRPRRRSPGRRGRPTSSRPASGPAHRRGPTASGRRRRGFRTSPSQSDRLSRSRRSSRTQWKLLPPKPNALTAARRGCSARGSQAASRC